MATKAITFSFLSVEIIVIRTEWLVCLPVNPAESLIDFINETSEFFPKRLFLEPDYVMMAEQWFPDKTGNLPWLIQAVVLSDIL